MPSKVNQEVVNFALAELNWGDCHKKMAGVENFKTQVDHQLYGVYAIHQISQLGRRPLL